MYSLFLLVLLGVAQVALAQDDGRINYSSTIPGFDDLRGCVRNCFSIGSTEATPDYAVNCDTNKCMCRSDLFPQAQNALYQCVRKICNNSQADFDTAKDLLKIYCNIKGYTEMGIATLSAGSSSTTSTSSSSSSSSTTGAYFTVTKTVYISHATKRVQNPLYTTLPRVGDSGGAKTWHTWFLAVFVSFWAMSSFFFTLLYRAQNWYFTCAIYILPWTAALTAMNYVRI